MSQQLAAGAKRKRGAGGYENGVGEFSVQNVIRQQLSRDVGDGDVLMTPSDRKQLMADDGSASRKLGQTQGLAKKARLEPAFPGAPGAPKLNSMAVLNPATALEMRRPPSLGSTYFQNDDGRTMGWMANDAIVVSVNCLLVHGDRRLTSKGHGQFQAMFVYRPDPLDHSVGVYRQTVRDAQVLSVSMLHHLMYHASDRNSRVTYGTKLRDILARWVPWGVMNALGAISGDPERVSGQPTAVLFVKGFTKSINYWAGCVPQVRDGAILWWLWCRRPRDERLANLYRDLLNSVQAFEYAPVDTHVRRELSRLIDDVVDFEAKYADAEWYWCPEPAVTYSMAEPDQLLWNHGEGHAIRYARMHEGCSQMPSYEKYLVNQHHLLHVTARSFESFEDAAQAAPVCRIDLF